MRTKAQQAVYNAMDDVLDAMLVALEKAVAAGQPRDEATLSIAKHANLVFTTYASSDVPIEDLRVVARIQLTHKNN